jgi:N-methylhydantoinase A/oxoprolinase/acetone carboxylase beta subunit
MFRIGCDVGGTNTDAAILDVTRLNDSGRGVLATYKTPTTSIVTHGIKTAIENVLVRSAIDRDKVLNHWYYAFYQRGG